MRFVYWVAIAAGFGLLGGFLDEYTTWLGLSLGGHETNWMFRSLASALVVPYSTAYRLAVEGILLGLCYPLRGSRIARLIPFALIVSVGIIGFIGFFSNWWAL